jgi:hypothetical protein
LILPSHQLGFTLTVCFPTQLLEVCPYTRKVTALRTYHLFSTTCFALHQNFRRFISLRKMLPSSFSSQETPLKTHK